MYEKVMIFRSETVISLLFLLALFSQNAVAQGVPCADRNTTEKLCTFSDTFPCCSSIYPLNGGTVFLPGDRVDVACHEAKAIFENASSSAFSDLVCNEFLDRIESSLPPPCSCKDKNRPPCADRNTTKKLCNFKDICCNKFLPYSFSLLLPDNETQVQCHDAKYIFESNSSTITDEECDILATRIESSLDTNLCNCKNEINAGPCAERQNGAFALCDFLPVGRECCPNNHPLLLPIPGSTQGASCGNVKSAYSNSQSSLWTNAECQNVKSTIETILVDINGCVCPGSPLLETDPPTTNPSSNPTISLSPSMLPSLSLKPSTSAIPTESMLPSSSSGPSEQPTMTASKDPSMEPSLRPSTSTTPTDLSDSSEQPTMTVSENPSMEPSLRPSTSAIPSSSAMPSEPQECSNRPEVKALCFFGNQCCIEGNGGLVRIPNATEVFCYQALALFKSEESKDFTDNECYLLKLGIESELGDGCKCSGFCFSGRSTVNVKGQGDTEMDRLRIGDMVLTGKDTYEPVYSFGHHGKGIQANFLRISTAKSSLDISPEHMVLTTTFNFVPASSLQEGDVLLNEMGREISIRSIETITSKGVYAPFTPSGRLLVNGILVSSFISLENTSSIKIMGVSISHQWIAHMFEFPHRVVCHYLGSCLNESYTKEGISTWVAYPLHLAHWLLNLPNGFFKSTLLVVFCSILCVCNILDFFLRMPVALSCIIFTTFVPLLRMQFREKRSM